MAVGAVLVGGEHELEKQGEANSSLGRRRPCVDEPSSTSKQVSCVYFFTPGRE
jgi:hypothetical protein